MENISEWNRNSDPHITKRKVIGFDLDDTLTLENGSWPSSTISGLENLSKAGWTILLVTGRPAGWADAFIRLFPLDAIVAENGAVIRYWKNKFQNRQDHETPESLYWTPEGSVKEFLDFGHREKMNSCKNKILSEVENCRVATDQHYRLYDLAIDFAEYVTPPLGMDAAHKIFDIFQEFKATAKISSIHVNGWWGDFSKGSALEFLSQQLLQFSIQEEFVYVGDSPNDGPLFKLAGSSIGVANINSFVGKVDFSHPKFVTNQCAALGALEVIKKCQEIA